MQKILLTGLLILLLAVPALAAEKEVAGVFFPLPEGWSVVEENTSGTTSTLLLQQADRRTAIAVMVAADAGLAPAQIAAELASVTGATADPVEREGQYSFPIKKDGQDGVCFLAQSNGRFVLVSVLGELPPAAPLPADLAPVPDTPAPSGPSAGRSSRDMGDSRTLWQQRPGLSCRQAGQSVFLADSHGDHIFRLDGTGAVVWQLLSAPLSRDEALSLLAETFPDVPKSRIRHELKQLFQALFEACLIEKAHKRP